MDSWEESNSLLFALGWQRFQKGMIAVVGAGGKTSTIFQLAHEFSEKGLCVGITTTTHMRFVDGIVATNNREIRAQLEERQKNSGQIIIAGIPTKEGKMKSLEEQDFQILNDSVDILLVEADGSKGLPLKVPATHEPVIPDRASHVLVLAGLSCLGKSIECSCHRLELVRELLRVNRDHIITPEDIAYLLFKGYLSPLSKNQYGDISGKDVSWTVILNQGDTENYIQSGKEVADRLSTYPVIITQLKAKDSLI